MAVAKSVYRLIREVSDTHKTYPAKLLEGGKLENRQIRETVTVCVNSQSVI